MRTATVDAKSRRLTVYTRSGYVLGHRCYHDHAGNRRLVRDGATAQCQGCGTHRYCDALGFGSRAEALAAEAAERGGRAR